MSAEVHDLLLGLERRLMGPEFRRDRVRVAELLSEEFVEFGASGRVWMREAILDLLATEVDYSLPEIEDFCARSVGEGVWLVTYRTVRPGRVVLRSSLWVLRAGSWQIVFHQGTLIGGEDMA